MGYKVKWVEDNLGVTRKALRGFEEAGLMLKIKVGSIVTMTKMISTVSGLFEYYKVWAINSKK